MIDGRPLVAGAAEGRLLVLDQPLSLWGGLDPATGRITDIRHPQHGESVSGRILLMRTGRGSSSSSTILAEAIRVGTAPAALLIEEADAVLVVGALVAQWLYDRTVPVVQISRPEDRLLRSGVRTRVLTSGTVEILVD